MHAKEPAVGCMCLKHLFAITYMTSEKMLNNRNCWKLITPTHPAFSTSYYYYLNDIFRYIF